MDDNTTSTRIECNPNSYALSGKIMLSSVVIMFTVVIFIVCFHSYARWFFLRRHHHSSRTRRRAHRLIFNSDSTTTNHLQGLDPSVLKSLPTFLYSTKTHDPLLECAVCLSEFEENDLGRLLPNCNHSFHIKCIDMWFHTHSNCPLCRALVEPVCEPVRTEAESSSGQPDPVCQLRDEDVMGCSSSSPPVGFLPLRSERKPLELVGITVEVPRRNLEEIGLGSPAEGQELKSPGSRILSLKKIWSI